MNQEQMEAFYEANCEGKALPRKQQSNDFNETWKFPNIVREQYGDHIIYEIAQLNELFRSGRPKYVCTFKKENKIVGLHLAMQLTSKKGDPYFVAQIKPMNLDDLDDLDESDKSDEN